jgi:SagB-type dehydrogenase family enzyme
METDMQTKRYYIIIAVLIFILGGFFGYWFTISQMDVIDAKPVASDTTDTDAKTYVEPVYNYITTIKLPAPDLTSSVSIEETLSNRRTVRVYDESPLSLENLSQMLWAAQGITDESGHRTAPSGHGLYPIDLFVAVSNVTGLETGLYHYISEGHMLGLIREGDQKEDLALVTPQPHPQGAPVTLYMSGNYLKPQEFFDAEAAETVTLQESGHIGQNLYLQAESLGLGLVVMGGFDPNLARDILGLTEDDHVMYLIPIGNKK